MSFVGRAVRWRLPAPVRRRRKRRGLTPDAAEPGGTAVVSYLVLLSYSAAEADDTVPRFPLPDLSEGETVRPVHDDGGASVRSDDASGLAPPGRSSPVPGALAARVVQATEAVDGHLGVRVFSPRAAEVFSLSPRPAASCFV